MGNFYHIFEIGILAAGHFVNHSIGIFVFAGYQALTIFALKCGTSLS